MSLYDMVRGVEKRFKKTQIYVSMPLLLKKYNYRKIIGEVSRSFVRENPGYRWGYFLNSFDEIGQTPLVDANEIELGYENLTQKEIDLYRRTMRGMTQERVMDRCLEAVTDSKAVLYILPEPVEIDHSLTLGAVSECDKAIENGEDVYICLYDLEGRKGQGVRSIFQISDLDGLFERFDKKAPSW